MATNVNETFTKTAAKVKSEFRQTVEDLTVITEQALPSQKVDETIHNASKTITKNITKLTQVATKAKDPETRENFSKLLEEVRNDLNATIAVTKEEVALKLEKTMKDANETLQKTAHNMKQRAASSEAAEKFRDECGRIMEHLSKNLERSKSDEKSKKAIKKASDDLMKSLDKFKEAIRKEEKTRGSLTSEENANQTLENVSHELNTTIEIRRRSSFGEKLEESLKQVNQAIISTVEDLHDTFILNDRINAEVAKLLESINQTLEELDIVLNQNHNEQEIDEIIQAAQDVILKEIDNFKTIFRSDELLKNEIAKEHARRVLKALRKEVEKLLRETRDRFDSQTGVKVEESMRRVNDTFVSTVGELLNTFSKSLNARRGSK